MTNEDFEKRRQEYNERFKPLNEEGEPTGEEPIEAKPELVEVAGEINREHVEAIDKNQPAPLGMGVDAEHEDFRVRKAAQEVEQKAKDKEKKKAAAPRICAVSGHTWYLVGDTYEHEFKCSRCETDGVIVPISYLYKDETEQLVLQRSKK